MTDIINRSRPTPSPLRHRPVLRPPRDIYSNTPKDDGAQGPRRPRRARPSRRGVIVVGGGVLAVCTVVTLVAMLFLDNRNAPRPAPRTSPTRTTPAAFADGASCRASDDGTAVRGDGPGGTDTGPHAILGFDYAYFVLRDGAAARNFVAPTAAVGPADQIQAGIATVPTGTQHCLSITVDGPDRYHVEVTTRHGRDAPQIYQQIVTTATTAGHVLITAITSVPQ